MQVVRGRDQVPFTIDLPKASQQETPQAPGFLYLPVHRLHGRLPLRVDRCSLFAPELAGHSGSGIGISEQRTPFRWKWLTMPQPTGGNVGVDALIAADLGVVLAPVPRIHRHHRGQFPGRRSDCCSIGSRCSTSGGWLLTPTATITWWSLSSASWQL